MLRNGVDANQERRTKERRAPRRVDRPERVAQGGSVDPRVGSMALVIGVFDVPQKEVDEADEPEEVGDGRAAGCVDACMKPRRAGRLEERARERVLGERLSPRDRHASAGAFVERPIALNLGKRFGHRHVATRPLQRAGRAGVHAPEAARAESAIEPMQALVTALRPGRAHVGAPPTPDALRGAVEQFRLRSLRLRVVAPEAVERAAFQEDRRSDSRSVVDREPLDVEHRPGHRKRPPSPRTNRFAVRPALFLA